MTRLPIGSGQECVQAIEKAGFYTKHQKGSHIIMRRDDPFAQTVVPNHRTLRLGTLRNIIAQAGLSVERFNELLRE